MTRSASRFLLLNSPARRLSMSVVGCLLVIDVVLLPFSALRFCASNIPVLIAVAAMFVLAGPLQRRAQFSPTVQNLAVDIYALLLFGGVGFICSYLAIERGWAMRDELFVSIDDFLGFDWRAYTSFILQSSPLRWASLVLYILTPPLVGFAMYWSCRQGQYHRASEMVTMVIAGGVLCVVISGILPAVGASGFYLADNDFYQGHKVVFDSSYKTTFFEIRDRAGMDIFLLRPVGLIAFPSYHACLAMLVMLHFWGHRLMSYTVIALNVGSVLSIPVQGGHYLSDGLGGLLLGAMVYWAVRKWSGQRTIDSPAPA